MSHFNLHSQEKTDLSKAEKLGALYEKFLNNKLEKEDAGNLQYYVNQLMIKRFYMLETKQEHFEFEYLDEKFDLGQKWEQMTSFLDALTGLDDNAKQQIFQEKPYNQDRSFEKLTLENSTG